MATYLYTLEAPMLVISDKDWVDLKTIPRSDHALKNGLLVDVETLSQRRKEVCIIFLSHRWLRPHLKEEAAHPDNAKGEKYQLICAALEVIRKSVDGAPLYIWCDYFGIDQDSSNLKRKGIRSLPAYIERSDMLLTPIPSNANYMQTQVEEIKAKIKRRGFTYVDKLGFTGRFKRDLGQYYHTEEIFTRGWIRLEEFLGSNVPLDTDNTFNYWKRVKCHRNDRPHLFCTGNIFNPGTGHSKATSGSSDDKEYIMVSLPRLSKGVLQLLNPLDEENSELTVEEDREVIREIMEVSGYDGEEFNRPLKDVYEGDTDTQGLPHGNGKLVYSDGDEFVGVFKGGKRHGKGTYYYSTGDKFEGQWLNDERDENSRFVATLATGKTLTTKIDFITQGLRYGLFPPRVQRNG